MIYYFTSESVTEGHPDKIADQISDAVLDAIMEKDPYGRVACETFVTTGQVLVAGQITTNCYVDIPSIARQTVKEIGYDDAGYGFDYKTCSVLTAVEGQSPDIAMGVDKALEQKEGATEAEFSIGAGDQGMMFGFACDETKELMPLGLSLAHQLCRRLTQVRKEGLCDFLRPDGKAQVTIQYEDGVPKRVDTVVVSSQHSEDVDMEVLRAFIKKEVILAVIPAEMIDEATKYYINPTGRFVIGGPMGDTGLTGRKIIVDTYGGMARHGGGCFSGKDATKVDRSAAYMARYIAKNIVAAGLAKRCEIQLAYAIGVAEPVSLAVDTFGTSAYTSEQLEKLVRRHFDMRPAAIIAAFDLRRPIYKKLAAYGQMGREDLGVLWEKTDKAEILKKDILAF